MQLREFATTVRFWVLFFTLLMSILIGLGATVDRPVWLSELNQHNLIDQKYRDRLTTMSGDVYQIQIDAVQRNIWRQEDRLKKHKTQDGKQRLRELKEQMRRLQEQKKRPIVKNRG